MRSTNALGGIPVVPRPSSIYRFGQQKGLIEVEPACGKTMTALAESQSPQSSGGLIHGAVDGRQGCSLRRCLHRQAVNTKCSLETFDVPHLKAGGLRQPSCYGISTTRRPGPHTYSQMVGNARRSRAESQFHDSDRSTWFQVNSDGLSRGCAAPYVLDHADTDDFVHTPRVSVDDNRGFDPASIVKAMSCDQCGCVNSGLLLAQQDAAGIGHT